MRIHAAAVRFSPFLLVAGIAGHASHVAAQAAPPAGSAGRDARLQLFWERTFAPMIETTIAKSHLDYERDFRRGDSSYDGCPEVKQAFQQLAGTGFPNVIREIVDQRMRPVLLGAVAAKVGRPELDAYLRFTETDEGRRWLANIKSGDSKGFTLERTHAYQADPALRAFDAEIANVDLESIRRSMEHVMDDPIMKGFQERFTQAIAAPVAECMQKRNKK